ncbi:DUF1127 domain-containing protein [Aestuariicoccus sp. MJ-SS9]|uniref:DUF1127 domain-containing protein n=1 Tax=Aestuariicoccus sp. MJ-SS9 TaxID=3079855 RepID=UPI002913236B|nr:DUF1127 domain-containing protein [Aestuariicoccus sp. MJ-SS9]MDU8911554.1 DUF1127 domain-containing protein [Aestuariicoccus sp. MJ-SS9]
MAQTTQTPLLAALSASPRLPALSVLALRVAVVIAKWSTHNRTRVALGDLDDHLLRDVGLDRRTAFVESRRWFWQ